MKKYFIAGTDTDIGKTYVSVKLLREFNQLGLKTIGIKPVATGTINGQNQDALLLQQHSSIRLDYSLINPFAFVQAISPNIAAPDLAVDKIWSSIQKTLSIKADIYIIEGVGGWFVPLNLQETMADLVKKIKDIEVILVVGIKLGCLSHSLLTYKAIKDTNIPIAGWIANIIDPKCQAINENIDTIKAYITEPCLRVIQYEYN